MKKIIKIRTCPPSKQHYTSHPNRYQIQKESSDRCLGNKLTNYFQKDLMQLLRIYSNLRAADPQIDYQLHMLLHILPTHLQTINFPKLYNDYIHTLTHTFRYDATVASKAPRFETCDRRKYKG